MRDQACVVVIIPTVNITLSCKAVESHLGFILYGDDDGYIFVLRSRVQTSLLRCMLCHLILFTLGKTHLRSVRPRVHRATFPVIIAQVLVTNSNDSLG